MVNDENERAAARWNRTTASLPAWARAKPCGANGSSISTSSARCAPSASMSIVPARRKTSPTTSTASTAMRREPLRARLVVGDHPHAEELRAAAVRVTERTARLQLHLVVAGALAHLLGGLAESHHARRADRVRREHAAR